MPLSSPGTIGGEIATAIQGIGVAPGTPVTGAQLTQVWTIVVQKLYTDLQSNAGVAPGTFNIPSIGTVVGTGGPLE